MKNIWKQATEWIQKANEWNVAEILTQNARLEEPVESMDYDPTWQALQECQIMLPLRRLLQLVPWFTEGLKTVLTSQNSEPAPVFLSNPKEGSTVVDTSNLTIIVITKGKEIIETIIEGGSGVNRLGHHSQRARIPNINVVLHLNMQGAYPLLLGRPWL